MEIKVGIIENEKLYVDSLRELLGKWSSDNSVSLQLEACSRGEEILSHNILNYHILFVDIQLDGNNGVEIARMLRQRNYSGEIVFLTSYREYVFDGYEVQALNYILKPISYEKLKKCMDIVMSSIQNEYYLFRNRDTIEKIPYNDIIYITSARHHMELVTTQKSYCHLIRIKDILKHLPSQFIQCHRTLIINTDYIQKLEGHTLVMRNKITLPVSNTYLLSVRQKLESLVF